MNLEKAKKLAEYTEKLAAGPDWGVDDQDTLEWLINRVEQLESKILSDLIPCDQCSGELTLDADGDWVCSQCGLSQKERRNSH